MSKGDFMQNRKSTLIVIIVLLILFVPLAIVSTILHFQNKNTVVENANHEFFYEGKLYFYKNEELLGTYTCQNTDYCDYAVSKNNFEYDLLEHKEEKAEKITLINDRYAFIIDTTTDKLNEAEIILYDLKIKKEIGRYQEVKNYGIGIDHNNYLVKNNEGLWGVLQFYDGVNLKIPFTYSYMALSDQKDATSNLISSDIISVLKDGSWYLIDINNNKLTENFTDKIVTYNNEYVVTSNNSTMHLSTYTGTERLSGEYQYLKLCGKYLAIVDQNNSFYFYDLVNNKEVSLRHSIKDPNTLRFDVTNESIKVYSGTEMIENIAIQ